MYIGGTTSAGMLISRSVSMRPMAGGFSGLASNCAKGARDGFDAAFCAIYFVRSLMTCLSCANSDQFLVGISFQST